MTESNCKGDKKLPNYTGTERVGTEPLKGHTLIAWAASAAQAISMVRSETDNSRN